MKLRRFVYPYQDISLEIQGESYYTAIGRYTFEITFKELFGEWVIFWVDEENIVESERDD